MPILNDDQHVTGFRGFRSGAQFAPVEEEGPSLGETFESAFRMENDIVNAVEMMTRPAFKADPLFGNKLGSELRTYDAENKTSFFDNYRDNFVGVQSRDEMLWMMQKIQREEADREVLARSGFTGFAAATAAGILSPTSFIPLVGPATKARTAWQFAKEAALLGTGVGIAQEGVLDAAQETRGWDEVALGVASSTVLSGLLGGAVGAMTKSEIKAVEQSFNQSRLQYSSAGAASAIAETSGNLASGAVTLTRVLDSNAITRSPVTFNIVQPKAPHLQSDVARGAMVQLSDGGYRLEGNEKGVPTAPGGTIENNIQTYYNVYPEVIKGLDENFLDYRFDGSVPMVAPSWRANLADIANATNGKLTKAEFRSEITKALRNNDEHAIPQVAKTAKQIRAQLIDPLLAEAQRVGILPEEIDLIGDTSWILRDYDRTVIKGRTAEFVNKLAAHFQRKLEDQFAQELSSLQKTKAKTTELTEDLARTPEDAANLRKEFLAKQKELDESPEALKFESLEDSIAELRSQARALRKDTTVAGANKRKQLLKDARDMEKAAGEDYAKLKSARGDITRRLNNLNRSAALLTQRQAQKFDAIEKIDELNMKALRRAAKAGQFALRQLDTVADDKLDEVVSRLKDKFAREGEAYDKGTERLTQMKQDDAVFNILPEAERNAARGERMSDIVERIDELAPANRAEARQVVNDLLEYTLEQINEVNTKRVARQQRLIEQADALDPAQVSKRINDINKRSGERELDFLDRWRTLGADDVDIAGNAADFRAHAVEIATQAKDRIMGTFLRLPNMDAVRGARGSEIARTLDIPSREIEEFLNNDVESLMRQTLRTFPPDIEIARRPEFGDINGEQMFQKLADEMNQRLQDLNKSDLSEAEKVKQSTEINDTYAQYRRNLEAVMGRLRHTWGLPQDPEGLGFRLGKTMMNLNVLRLMGGVVISSIPDVARPVMRYGLTRTFKDGFIPLITGFKEFRATAREVKQLSGGMSVALQSRASAMFDLLDDIGRGSKFEQSVEFATRRFGLLALFDYWTQGMKQFSGAIAHAKLLDSVDSVVNGTGDIAESTRFLAENGIDGGMAQRIWGQMVEAGGADKVDGTWWPNTQNWKDGDVLRAYSQAVTREVNTSIVTPGVEKPLWMDQSITGRMLGQFKSFAFASTSKMLGAGMQQRDAALLNGIMFSLALGAGSYWLYAMSVGGKTKQEMLNAGPDKWADEALSRSGLLGILSEVQRIAERIPATQPYATFSGTRSARRGGDNLTEALLGPSFDLLSTGAEVVAGIHDPTTSTVHQARTLAPGQNLMFIRQLFDQAEGLVPAREPQ